MLSMLHLYYRSNKSHMCMLKVIYSYFYSSENERNNAIKQINKKIYPLDKNIIYNL